jgi:hypothetical protein
MLGFTSLEGKQMSTTNIVECPQCGNNIVAETVTVNKYRDSYVRRYARSGARDESNRVGLFCLSTALLTLLSFVGVILLFGFSQGIYTLLFNNGHPNAVVFLLYLFGLPIVLAILLTNIMFRAFHIKVNWSGVPVVRCEKCGFRLGGFHG